MIEGLVCLLVLFELIFKSVFGLFQLLLQLSLSLLELLSKRINNTWLFLFDCSLHYLLLCGGLIRRLFWLAGNFLRLIDLNGLGFLLLHLLRLLYLFDWLLHLNWLRYLFRNVSGFNSNDFLLLLWLFSIFGSFFYLFGGLFCFLLSLLRFLSHFLLLLLFLSSCLISSRFLFLSYLIFFCLLLLFLLSYFSLLNCILLSFENALFEQLLFFLFLSLCFKVRSPLLLAHRLQRQLTTKTHDSMSILLLVFV